MCEYETISVNKDEKAVLDLIRSSAFQKITLQISGNKITNVKKEESLRPDRYQSKLVPDN